MKWKINANLIVILIFSIMYTIVTLLNIIGPLHTNSAGNINKLGAITVYSIIYWIFALFISWIVYFSCMKPKFCFYIINTWYISYYNGSVFMGMDRTLMSSGNT